MQEIRAMDEQLQEKERESGDLGRCVADMQEAVQKLGQKFE